MHHARIELPFNYYPYQEVFLKNGSSGAAGRKEEGGMEISLGLK